MSATPRSRDERREQLYARLVAEYAERFPRSRAFHEQASTTLVGGGSHTARMFDPFPVWTQSARGAHIHDLDDHTLLDFWQGHFANLLGHNPAEIASALVESLQAGHGLQSGMQDTLEYELADLLCSVTGAEMIRFTISGSLATMYAVLLARVYTGRSLVLKVGGGWHGAQPWSLKGVGFSARAYQGVETEGLPGILTDELLVTRFNDVDALETVFRQYGDRIACFIVEPFMGGGGLLAGRPEFLQRARSLTAAHGALLIFDEIIAGFRFCAGALASLYGIKPDLTTLGKIIGGGMPLAAVAGRADVMGLCGKAAGRRARFEGGTYSAHPLSMQAALCMVRHLKAHERDIYPRLGRLGAQLRGSLEEIFARQGIRASCSGDLGPAMAGSSIFSLHFPLAPDAPLDRPDIVNDPASYDVGLREQVMKIALLLEGVYCMHAGGAISLAHTEGDMGKMEDACRAVAIRLREAGLADD
jgi:glutamate-1-semialdehyde 2,1-aminomutase